MAFTVVEASAPKIAAHEAVSVINEQLFPMQLCAIYWAIITWMSSLIFLNKTRFRWNLVLPEGVRTDRTVDDRSGATSSDGSARLRRELENQCGRDQ